MKIIFYKINILALPEVCLGSEPLVFTLKACAQEASASPCEAHRKLSGKLRWDEIWAPVHPSGWYGILGEADRSSWLVYFVLPPHPTTSMVHRDAMPRSRQRVFLDLGVACVENKAFCALREQVRAVRWEAPKRS